MEVLIPKSFVQLLAGGMTVIAIILVVISIFSNVRSHATRLLAIMLVTSLALFSDHWTTYFAGIFIIATAVTELEFLQNLAAILRGDKNYFDYRKAISGKIQAPQEDAGPNMQPMELADRHRYALLEWHKDLSMLLDKYCDSKELKNTWLRGSVDGFFDTLKIYKIIDGEPRSSQQARLL